MANFETKECVASWLLGSAVELRDACQKSIDYVVADGGDPRTVFIEVANGTSEPNLAQLIKKTLTDKSCVYDLVIQ